MTLLRSSENRKIRLELHQKRVNFADSQIARHISQEVWSIHRSSAELIRPLARLMLSNLINKSRFLQRKLNRPAPLRVKYDPVESKYRPVIFHILANFEIGGTPQLVCDIIEYTQDKFSHVIISKHIAKPAPYIGIDIVDIPLPLKSNILEKYVNEKSPCLIHVHYWNGTQQDFTWYHSVFKTLEEFDIPIIENVNTSGEPYFSDKVSKYVFCSEWSRLSSGADWLPEQVIYPGTRAGDFLRGDLNSVPDDKIGMVYRLDGDKIGPNAIEIFIEVMKSRKSTKCVIVGDGLLIDHFKKRINQEELSDRAEFTSWVSYERLKEIYQEISIFLAPVKDDTFGSVSVYAMCAGIPVVGFDVGGIPEIVGSEDLLAPPGDVARFAQIVVDLLADRDRRLRIGAANQARAQALFTVGAMTDAFRRLYESEMRATDELALGGPRKPQDDEPV